MSTTEHIAADLRPLAQPIDLLKLLPGNPRRGDVEAVMRSYDRFGQRKPIVARRSDMTVIAGNHQLQAAQRLGWSHIAVVWTDDDDLTAKAFALADNRTADLGAYDDVDLRALIEEVAVDEALLIATSWSTDDLLSELSNAIGSDDDISEKYTTAINVPQYNIVGERPEIHELYDAAKLEELHSAIASSDVPDDVKDFLRIAAYRHVVFNYRKVAEFYPHMDAKVQRLMEDSALVIIDYDDAMRNGYVKMTAALEAIRKQDADADT